MDPQSSRVCVDTVTNNFVGPFLGFFFQLMFVVIVNRLCLRFHVLRVQNSSCGFARIQT